MEDDDEALPDELEEPGVLEDTERGVLELEALADVGSEEDGVLVGDDDADDDSDRSAKSKGGGTSAPATVAKQKGW